MPVTGRFVMMARLLQSPPSYIAPKTKDHLFSDILQYFCLWRGGPRGRFMHGGGGVRRGGGVVSCEVNNANLMKKSFRLLYVERLIKDLCII